ncbi:MAG TPA: type II toxin-antitoxin system VapC family toxin [Polyangiales bacterium]
MRLALDTNRYTDFARGDAELVELLEGADAVHLPFVVLAELRAGFAAGQRGRDNERVLQEFLTRPGVDPLFADDVTTRHYAAVYRQLRAQGTPIPTHDLWIAALALQHELVLVTRDAHFDRLPQLARA